ncbi:MAG: Fic family protein [Nitriliruptoraceae bacterium]
MTRPFTRSPHLVTLIAEVERLAARLAAADPEARQRLREQQVLAAARASLALDGARAAAMLDPEVATARARQAGRAGDASCGTSTEVAHSRRTRATWLDTFGALDDPEEDLVAALELLGVRTADDSDDLVDAVLPEAATVLPELHRRLTRGLVAPERAGALRQVEQAVHDGATGRIVFRAAPPGELPREVSLLGAWLASTGAREHGLVASGILHLELLRLHPFDAANGRLARAAARLVLRSRELDPDHLAVPEVALGRDLLGYHEEVARTLRRRDATIWLERWAEAVAAGLRLSTRIAGLHTSDPAPAAADFAASSATFTITELRAELGVGPEGARAHVDALLDAGLIERVPASRGLRFETSHATTA